LSEAITGDGAAIFRHACWMDLEGIVSKRIGSRYVSGRTRAWLKTKNPNFERSRLRNPGTYNVASRVRLLTVLAVVGRRLIVHGPTRQRCQDRDELPADFPRVLPINH
jgi:hypothetical protein